MKRFFKHFFYGLFYLGVLAGIGYLVYLGAIKPAPSCFDNIKNQNEEAVDCGGICSNICLPATLSPLNLSGQAKLFTLPNGLVSTLYTLRNPNQDYAIKDFAYDIVIHDASGAVIKTVSGRSFIYAAESKYIEAPAIDIGSTTAASADFTATDTIWIKADMFQAPRFQIQSPNISENLSSVTITGRIINQDTTVFPSVLLIAVLGDNFGEQIGVAQTTLENFGPGETRNFTIIHPALPDINLSSTQIFYYALRP